MTDRGEDSRSAERESVDELDADGTRSPLVSVESVSGVERELEAASVSAFAFEFEFEFEFKFELGLEYPSDTAAGSVNVVFVA